MTPHALPEQPVAECRWSVPACRPILMNGGEAFESYWICERTFTPRLVSQTDCSVCAYRSPETVCVRARK